MSIEKGGLVPADLRLIEVDKLRVSEAALIGERRGPGWQGSILIALISMAPAAIGIFMPGIRFHGSLRSRRQEESRRQQRSPRGR